MKKSLQIVSEPKRIARVEQFMKEILKESNMDKNLYSRIFLAVIEGVNNAIFHGNKLDPQKVVDITYLDDKEKFVFIIKDEGKGFNIKNIKNPLAPENIAKESGRGIFIMKQFATDVKYSNNGSTIQLTFSY